MFEIVDGEEQAVASQLDGNYDTTLRWILAGETLPGTTRNFVLKSVPENDQPDNDNNSEVKIEDDGKSLTLKVADKNILSYRYAVKNPPEGVSELFARGGIFIRFGRRPGKCLPAFSLPTTTTITVSGIPGQKPSLKERKLIFGTWLARQKKRERYIPLKVSGILVDLF